MRPRQAFGIDKAFDKLIAEPDKASSAGLTVRSTLARSAPAATPRVL
jgi:hypothetical protein